MNSQHNYLYPKIAPYETGVIDVGDGHSIAYELCGNPAGKPVVFLHGGPGSGCSPDHRRFFDPAFYRIVLFDQRGSGRSTPLASIENNTTQHIVADIEVLRFQLNIQSWIVFGGSWGSTLALAYGAAHPESCAAFVLRGIWLCRPADTEWWMYGVKNVFPDLWREFAEFVPPEERTNLLETYYRCLMDNRPEIYKPAALAWKNYERRRSTLLPGSAAEVTWSDQTLAMSRIGAHYTRNAAFLGEGELIRNVGRIRHLPAVIIHGRYDMVCQAEGAFELAAAWPEAKFHVVEDAGHSAMEPGICKLLVEATNEFRHLPA